MLRANVVARGPHLPLWQGLAPHVLLRDFFDADELPLRWCKTGLLSTFFAKKGVIHATCKAFSQEFHPFRLGWHSSSYWPEDLFPWFSRMSFWTAHFPRLSLYGDESMREAFDAAAPASQGHFVTMLSRVAFIEAMGPKVGKSDRPTGALNRRKLADPDYAYGLCVTMVAWVWVTEAAFLAGNDSNFI